MNQVLEKFSIRKLLYLLHLIYFFMALAESLSYIFHQRSYGNTRKLLQEVGGIGWREGRRGGGEGVGWGGGGGAD
jgi:hypothetical protein